MKNDQQIVLRDVYQGSLIQAAWSQTYKKKLYVIMYLMCPNNARGPKGIPPWSIARYWSSSSVDPISCFIRFMQTQIGLGFHIQYITGDICFFNGFLCPDAKSAE